jgi:hypothetical protein
MISAKNMSFDTDYGIVGLSVSQTASESDFDFDNANLKKDGECGTTIDLATKSYVLAAISSKMKRLENRITNLEEIVSKLAKNTK